MRRDRGFALIAALWVIVALTSVVGLGVATTRLGQRTSLNRIALTRGRWAAEACLAITQRRWLQHRLSDTASIDLGRGTRCNWNVWDPGTRININLADRETLTRLIGDSILADSLVKARRITPFISAEQLPSRWRSVLTVEGRASVNLNAAPERVLSALPGMSAEAVDHLVQRRRVGRAISSLDELTSLLSPAARAALFARYPDLARIAVFTPTELVITATGWVEGQGPRSRIELVAVPLPERLAIIRRRLW